MRALWGVAHTDSGTTTVARDAFIIKISLAWTDI